jgi:hypothetical protein
VIWPAEQRSWQPGSCVGDHDDLGPQHDVLPAALE